MYCLYGIAGKRCPILVPTSDSLVSNVEQWNRWAEQCTETTAYLVDEVYFALYLQHVGESTQSKSAAEEAVNAISWIQQLADHRPVSASPIVYYASRIAMEVGQTKEPITMEMLWTARERPLPCPTSG